MPSPEGASPQEITSYPGGTAHAELPAFAYTLATTGVSTWEAALKLTATSKKVRSIRRWATFKFWAFLLASVVLAGLGLRPDTWFNTAPRESVSKTPSGAISASTEVHLHSLLDGACRVQSEVPVAPDPASQPKQRRPTCAQRVRSVPSPGELAGQQAMAQARTAKAASAASTAVAPVSAVQAAATPLAQPATSYASNSSASSNELGRSWVEWIAGPTHSRLAWLQRFVYGLLALAAFKAYQRHHAEARVATRVWKTMAKRSNGGEARVAGHPNWASNLMPSQREFVDHYYAEFKSRDTQVLSTKPYAIRGVWGTGKSTVLQAMRLRLEEEAADEALPVFLNAWREESPDDLHFRMVAHLALEPAIFAICSSSLSDRFMQRLAQDQGARRTFGIAELLTKFKAKRHIGETETESEVQITFDLPTQLDFQDDLESLVAATRNKGKTIVLFVDEIERGTSLAAQALVVLLRRSFDLQGLQLVIPFVPDIMDAAVFDPLNQQAPELLAATEAVVSSHANGKLRKLAYADIKNIMAHSLDADRLARQRTVPRGEKPPHQAQDGTSAPALPFGKSPIWNKALTGHLIRLYTELPRHEQAQVMAKIREKYFGFARDLAAPKPEDFAFLLLHNTQFLGLQVQDRLIDVLMGGGLSEPDATAAVKEFLYRPPESDPSTQRIPVSVPEQALADELTRLLVLAPG
jgi:hypothetical protein